MGELFEVRVVVGPCFWKVRIWVVCNSRIVFDGVESTEVQVFGAQGKLEDGLRKREVS